MKSGDFPRGEFADLSLQQVPVVAASHPGPTEAPAVASTAYLTGSAPASVRVSVQSTTTWRWRINHLPSLLTNESR
jgi:hypothetical protein